MDHNLSEILGKIILLQSTLHVMKDDLSMAKFACRGFSQILCMETVGMYIGGNFHCENGHFSMTADACRQFFDRLSVDSPASRHNAQEEAVLFFEKKFNVHCLMIATGFDVYGFLFVQAHTGDADDDFQRIRPYVENTLNLLALIIENNVQKKLLQNSKADLEKQVAERTRELTLANQTLEDRLIERTRMEEALRQQEALYHDLVETSQDLIWRCDSHGRYTYLNPAWEKVFGYKLEEMLGKKFSEFQTKEMAERDRREFAHLMQGNAISGYETIHLGKAGNEIHLVFNARHIANEEGTVIGTRGTAYDITSRKQAEHERNQLQDQLLQAMKMDSIGKLAGGVAHDFNNMIMVIMGNAEIALEEVAENNLIHQNLIEIINSAKRSADLTRQLLAFARKQTISPKIVALNDLVTGMVKMLQRLIGEDIELKLNLSSGLWPIKMDPTQIDQILANLTVNARDAINGVGRMSIETMNVHVDEAFVLTGGESEAAPGDYVMLAISDSGCGIDKKNLPHIFEPFFTTKEIGKGTGLGLATVYGIIKQNNGFINIYSEPGQGTTFRIYLPCSQSNTDEVPEPRNNKSPRGDETILLVEDEAPILLLGKKILERHGYTVIAAQTPLEALSLVENHNGVIHLLITDVVMPAMNGKILYEKIRELRPGIKTLFMSGYTSDIIAHHGVLDEGIRFLEKPFSVKTLATKTREILDASLG